MNEDALFHDALAKSPAERAAFLDEACAGQPVLRAALEARLAAQEAPSTDEQASLPCSGMGTVPTPERGNQERQDAALGKRSTADWQPAQSPGAVIAGRYALVELIGTGGMGEVWVAKQTEPVKRKVALKLIKAGMDSKMVLARFEAERQALALMDHPNIAKVLDGGVTSAGHPFFVMELVNGMPLTKFCDEARLTPRERLELFVPICQAVQHAHQKGIVHRDLKPTNILVTLYDGRAMPKVIDFGVAKAVAGKLTDESLSTQFGAVVGTLDYMAPEQAGLLPIDIDTRADIYSLGVILYELLTGLRPFDAKRLRKAALDEAIRIVREEEPSKPSTRLSSDLALVTLAALRQTEPKRLVALMRGELDCIVMKALEKDRSRRYETANGLARDIQHFLADEPVEAQPPSMGYKMGKFLRKNKVPVASASAVLFMLLLCLIGGTAGIIWYQNEEAKRDMAEVVRKAEEERKEQQRAAAEAWRKADENLKEAERRAALAIAETIAERKRELGEQGITAAIDEAERSRAQLSKILDRRGGVFGLLNEPGRWEAHLQSAQGPIDRAKALAASAEDFFVEDLKKRIYRLEPLLAQDEADRQMALRLEKIRTDRSALVEGRFDNAKARREYSEAFADAKLSVLEGDAKTLAKQVGSSAIKEQLVAALDDWAFVNFKAGNEERMERLLEVARLANPDPEFADRLRQPKLWKDPAALTGLAKEIPPANLSPQLLGIMGALLPQSLEEENWLRHAQAHFPADFWLNYNLGVAIGKTKPVEAEGFFRAALAVRPGSAAAYNNLGIILTDQKRTAEAVAACKKAIKLEPDYARAYMSLGIAFRDQKRPSEAIVAYQKAIGLQPKFAMAYYNLGVVLFEQKRPGEAIAAFQKAIDIEPNFAKAYYDLGTILRQQKRPVEEAIAAFEKAIELEPKNAKAYNNLGNARRDQKRLDEAVAAFKKAIDIEPRFALAYNNLGIALRDQKRPPEAIAAFQKAIDVNPKFAKPYSNLGLVYYEQRRLAEAGAAIQKAIDLDPKYAIAYTNLGLVFHAQKRFAEAVTAHQKAIELEPLFAVAYHNLGLVLQDQRRPAEAIAAYQKAIALEPKFARAYHNLGTVLYGEKRLPEAVAAYQKAIELEPTYASAHAALGQALLRQGLFAQAAAATQKALDLFPASHPLRAGVQRQQKQAQEFVALEKRLPLVLENKEDAGPNELLALAQMCQQYRKRNASAARLYQEAFQAQPRLADDLGKQHRYNAACSAALAGCGQGEEAAKLMAEEKSKLRHQARDWLQADFDSYAKLLKKENVGTVMQVIQQLTHWQQDQDLAGVRDVNQLVKLPDEEKQSWQKLWTDVRELHKEAQSRISETRLQGSLSAKETSKVHEIKLTAGKTYVIDMESKDFDTYLKLEDPQGKLLAENDDISPTNQNSRILFTPKQDGTYRVIATSVQQQGQGQYEIIIRTFVGKEKQPEK
jgi:serine/threonine protein kinase/tetratricopeptide (TPR) repeat protein